MKNGKKHGNKSSMTLSNNKNKESKEKQAYVPQILRLGKIIVDRNYQLLISLKMNTLIMKV